MAAHKMGYPLSFGRKFIPVGWMSSKTLFCLDAGQKNQSIRSERIVKVSPKGRRSTVPPDPHELMAFAW
jgi:hypothetical protein